MPPDEKNPGYRPALIYNISSVMGLGERILECPLFSFLAPDATAESSLLICFLPRFRQPYFYSECHLQRSPSLFPPQINQKPGGIVTGQPGGGRSCCRHLYCFSRLLPWTSFSTSCQVSLLASDKMHAAASRRNLQGVLSRLTPAGKELSLLPEEAGTDVWRD